MVAPGDYGVEVGDEVLGEARGEGFAAEFGGEAGGEVLKHDETDEEAVARGPGGGLIAEEAELEREVGALDVDGGVDSGGVALEEAFDGGSQTANAFDQTSNTGKDGHDN